MTWGNAYCFLGSFMPCIKAKAANKRDAIYDTQHNRPLIMPVMAAMTKKRNAIGDEFNSEVAAYKEANPKE